MTAPIPRPANWPPFTRDPTPRDWIEDDTHENGHYWRTCCACHETFVGHKRRVVCRACFAADDAEAKRRAEWLDTHNAPKDWVVLTSGEVAQMKAELVQLVWSESEAKRHLHAIADVIEPHWKGAGAPLESGWIIDRIVDLARDYDAATDQNDALCASLEDIHTTAHCLAKAGPLNTPTLDAAWVAFMRIGIKATAALAATRQPAGVTEKLGKTREELDKGYAAFQRDLGRQESGS